MCQGKRIGSCFLCDREPIRQLAESSAKLNFAERGGGSVGKLLSKKTKQIEVIVRNK